MKKTILPLGLLLAMTFMVMAANAQVSIGVSVDFAPPPIPVYAQPACPVEGYIWIPGYWAWDDDYYDDDEDGYYWVPGYWAAPPQIGYLWTPGYWGWSGGAYLWHTGYWGPHIGYYGGINYGCGYVGTGYCGGEWRGGRFVYNTAITNVNTTIVHNTYYNRTVINNVNIHNRISYNGGPGGIQAQPNMGERMAMNERHIQRTDGQLQHQQAAMHDRGAFASANRGRPATMTTAGGGRPNYPAYNSPAMNRPQMSRPQMSRPEMSRSQPQMYRPQPQFHQQPQMFRSQPQMYLSLIHI